MIKIIDLREIPPAKYWKDRYLLKAFALWNNGVPSYAKRDIIIHENLLLLADDAPQNVVEAVIGHPITWPPYLWCDACCKKSSLCSIVLGEEEDDESRTTALCPHCFAEAVALVRVSGICTGI